MKRVPTRARADCPVGEPNPCDFACALRSSNRMSEHASTSQRELAVHPIPTLEASVR